MVDAQQILQDWGHRGFVGGFWIDPPGRAWERCRHDADQLLMLLDGNIELDIEGLVVCPSHGEEVLIPAGAVHSVRNVGGTDARWLYAQSHARS
jgi:quercetin dioxygenase-like cupin family protein